MDLNRNNYEVYFIDYLEGNLDEKFVDEFIEFLQKNPDLKEELKNLEKYNAEEEEVLFPHKEKLYKEKFDSPDIFIHTAIGVSEKDLNTEEILEFEAYLDKHPEKKKEVDLYKKIKLVPDESIVFKNREKLIKQTPVQKIGFYVARIAAVLIIAFSVSIILKQYSVIEVPPAQIVKLIPPAEIPETNKEVQKEVKTKPQKEMVKPVIKDTIKVEKVKSIRENNRGRVEGGDLMAFTRDTVNLPYMNLIAATYITEIPEIALAPIERAELPLHTILQQPEGEILLADKLRERAGLDNFRLNDITKAGFKLFSNLSKNKFNYATNENGEITEINLETRLLAFSIPTRNSAE